MKKRSNAEIKKVITLLKLQREGIPAFDFFGGNNHEGIDRQVRLLEKALKQDVYQIDADFDRALGTEWETEAEISAWDWVLSKTDEPLVEDDDAWVKKARAMTAERDKAIELHSKQYHRALDLESSLTQAQAELADEKRFRKQDENTVTRLVSECATAHADARQYQERLQRVVDGSKALTAKLAEAVKAWDLMAKAISGLFSSMPPRPICASHAQVPVHIKHNMWDARVEIEEAWDVIDKALAPAAPAKEKEEKI